MKKLLLLFLLILAVATYYYHAEYNRIEKEIYIQNATKLQNKAKNAIADKADRTAALAYLLSRDRELRRLLREYPKARIDYRNVLDGLRRVSDYKNLWIQVIDRNGTSLYRSWTDKKEDRLIDARIDIRKVLQSKEALNTISTGKYDITFKSLMPVFDADEFLGIVELISHFNSIATRFQRQGIEPLLVVGKRYSAQVEHPFSGLHIGPYYIGNENASPTLLASVNDRTLEKLLASEPYGFFREAMVIHYDIADIEHRPMAHFLLFEPLEQIEMNRLNDFKMNFLFALFLMLVIFTLAALLYLYKKYNRDLHREVERKTAIVRKKSDELQTLLSTYDEHVILSQTDLHGVITHVSKAFCDISGYTKEELIGQTHNIVRHPDMPKAVFKKLWRGLSKEQWMHLEIKNRRKDGSIYWVNAHIGPFYDNEGRHIGYVAVRQDITAIKEIEEMQKEIILVMGTIGERRSKETSEHVKRVAAYSRLLACYCGLGEEECNMIEQASPMHDIGKIAIPDEILNKPAPLTEAEYAIMMTHAQEGYKMLNVSERPLLKMAATIALEHHEKWDGSGYPRGLAKEEISLVGRIVALADIFDALSHDRCYKKAWEEKAVLEHIRKARGKHLDPTLVDIFFEHLDEFLAIKRKYSDCTPPPKHTH